MNPFLDNNPEVAAAYDDLGQVNDLMAQACVNALLTAYIKGLERGRKEGIASQS